MHFLIFKNWFKDLSLMWFKTMYLTQLGFVAYESVNDVGHY